MHVCGACGVREPIQTYGRMVGLSNLSADDWLRAKSAFVVQISALGSVTLLARGDPPLPERLSEPDLPSHRPVHVPLALLLKLDGWAVITSTLCARRSSPTP
jgi:hypothetical protein